MAIKRYFFWQLHTLKYFKVAVFSCVHLKNRMKYPILDDGRKFAGEFDPLRLRCDSFYLESIFKDREKYQEKLLAFIY